MCVDCLSTHFCIRRFRTNYFDLNLEICVVASGKAKQDALKEASRRNNPHTESGYISVLYRAAASNNVALVKRVLRRAAHNSKFDINQATATGGTTLIYASQHGSAEVVKVLLGVEGINANLPLHNGRTPLFMSAQSGHLHCVQLLLAVPGIKVNRAKDTGETPLLISCQEGYLECVLAFLAHPTIKVDQATRNGRTPLQIACYRGHAHVVTTLLAPDVGVDVNKPKMQGSTALWLATKRQHPTVIRMLLDHPNIRVNDADNTGRTPLYVACEMGHLECLRLLLLVDGIDASTRVKHPRKPIREGEAAGEELLDMFDIAKRNGHDDVLNLLRDFGHIDEEELIMSQGKVWDHVINRYVKPGKENTHIDEEET